jgi:branched-chain amino acid transport system substrate-binding protein
MLELYARHFRTAAALVLSALILASAAACDDDGVGADDGEVLIGGVFSLTGNWSSLGVASQAALELAVQDVNAYVAGDGPRFRASIEDSKLEPQTALEKLRALREDGARLVIGPQSSAEAAAMKSYADENGVLLVSQSSTAGSLAIPGDNLFRLTPADSLEGVASAALMRADSIRAMVPVYLNDAGNAGLATGTRNAFTARGGTASTGVSYPAGTTSFAATVAAVKAQVQQAIATHGASRVGVYLSGFDEVVGLIALAGADSTLVSVRWYGSDGVANSGALQANAQTVQFAERVGYPAALFGLDDAAVGRSAPIAQRIRARTGAEPDAFALAVYDAAWIGALAYLAGNDVRPDAATLKARYQTVAASYFGTTGWTALNAAGDRATADFDFFALRHVAGVAQWVRVARYDTGSGTLTR